MKARTSIIQTRHSHNSFGLLLMIGIALLFIGIPVNAQTGGAAHYRYDANGRLTAVLSPTGEAVTYSYDPAGNFTSITRYAANQLSILDFTPGSGGIGTQVTIYGTGFSTTPSANTVKFNNVIASVTAATNIQLTVTVPAGATTGPINVSNANGAVNSSTNFFVAGNVEFSHQMVFGESKAFTFANPYPAQLTKVGLLTFDGIANQRISLIVEDLISCLLNSNIPPFKYAQVSIISPDGVSIASAPLRNYWFSSPPPDYYPPSGIPGIPSASFAWIEAIALPATGKYTVLIDPTDSSYCGLGAQYGFGATARLYDVPPDMTGTIATSGLSLPLGFASPGQNAVFTFAGLNGQRIYLQGVQDGGSTQIATDVKLFAPGAYPSGTPLTTRTLGADFFVDTTTLTANGTYTILLDPQLNKTRAVTLNLYDIPPDVSVAMTVYSITVPPPPNPLPLNEKTLVTIPSVGQAANLTFSVPSNQSVTTHIRELKIAGGGVSSSTLTLSTQSGTQIFTQTINYGVDYTIPQILSPGNYVLKIDPHQAAIGSLEIILTTP